IHHRPRNELQAKFSMEFCMAILLLERKAGLEQFTDEAVNRPDVQALLQRVDFGVNAEAEAAGFDKMTTIVEVELDDGTVVKGAADFGKGSPANLMSDDELKEKFRQCAAWGGLDVEQTRTVIDLAWRIETLEDVDRKFRIAVIPGDGIGNEVVPEGLRVLDRLAATSGGTLAFEYESFPWGCEYYLRTGRMIDDDALARLSPFDAIYFGAVGWPGVPDHA